MSFLVSGRNLWQTAWWLDPILRGSYPADGIKAYGEDFPAEMIRPGDMELISQPMDFLGTNLYQGTEVKADKDGNPVIVPRKKGFDSTAFKWGVTPRIMHYMPNFLYERYQLPIVITENGLSLSDWINIEGEVPDFLRIDFMHRYLLELTKSLQDGTLIRGYFAWSFLDNYEWSNGYTERFGLIHVDYETQKRTRKASAYWYTKVIGSNGKTL
jgi:beta-glucosidase